MEQMSDEGTAAGDFLALAGGAHAALAGADIDELLAHMASVEQELSWARQRIVDLEDIAEIDELTGLLNQRGLRRQMTRLLARSNRHGDFGSILFIDIDDLADVNERYGEAAGDAALRHVAKMLVLDTRAGDLVARYGGDEFAVVLERCTQRNAEQRARVICDKVAAAPLDIGGSEIRLSLRMGLSGFGGQKCADHALDPRQAAELETGGLRPI